MSQSNEILAHLEAGNTITPLEALAKFKCFRLAARIMEIRKSLPADAEIVTETHRTLDGKEVARYRLVRRMFAEKSA